MPETPEIRLACPMASNIATWLDDMHTTWRTGAFTTCPAKSAGALAALAQDQQVLFDVRAALPRIADRDERRGVIPVPADVEARRVGRGVNLGCEIAQNWPRRASAGRCEGRGKG